jgi:hypothetical protein
MKRYLNSSGPSEAEVFEVSAGWTAPCRGIQPSGFTVLHQHEEWPEATIIRAQDIARFSAEFIEFRKLVAEMRSEIQRALSQSNELRSRERKARWIIQDVSQGVLPFLPNELLPISEAIEKSKVIYSRSPDPSDELGLKCTRATWQRAIKLLTDHALSVWERARVVIRPPNISPGPDGSIDLYWAANPFGLLVNVPADPDKPPTYFGDDSTNPESNRTSGMINPLKPVDIGVLMWLAHTAEK